MSKNYTIPENPVYDENIRKIQNGDYVDAENVLNPVLQKIINNQAAHQKNKADLLNGKVPPSQLPALDFVPLTRKINGKTLNADIDLSPSDVGVTAKRTCTFVVGTSTAGWTEADCDYLCDGTADDVEINAAIQALPKLGGTVLLLRGNYICKSPIRIGGTFSSSKPYTHLTGTEKSACLMLSDDFTRSEEEGIICIKYANTAILSDLSISASALVNGVSLSDSVDNLYVTNVDITSSLCSIKSTSPPYHVCVRGCNLYGVINLVGNSYNSAIVSDCIIDTGIADASFGGNSTQYFSYVVFSNNIFRRGLYVHAKQAFIVNNHLGDNVPQGSLSVSMYGRSIYNTYSAIIASNSSFGEIILSDAGSALICNNYANVTSFMGSGIRIVNTEKCLICGNVIRNPKRGDEYSNWIDSEYPIVLEGSNNNDNLVANNLMFKEYKTEGGTGNTFVNNQIFQEKTIE